MKIYQKSKKAILAAYLMVLSWTIAGLFFTILLVKQFVNVYVSPHLGMFLLMFLVVIVIVYVLVALDLRCEICKRRFLLETSEGKSPEAHKTRHIDYWATAIFDILKRKEFTCMYCGEKYQVK